LQALNRIKINGAFNLGNACICCNAFISSHFELFLAMISKEDIEKMSVSDRLETIEKIWESISVSGYVQSPDWHQTILKSREDKVTSGNANFLDIDEVKERLKRKSDENSRHS
jgi:putative addiction module component (TIGR02574 family)